MSGQESFGQAKTDQYGSHIGISQDVSGREQSRSGQARECEKTLKSFKISLAFLNFVLILLDLFNWRNYAQILCLLA